MINFRQSMPAGEGATSPTTTNAIRVHDLHKAYGRDVQALSGLSFTVSPGEIFGLLGPNGAGKSTTVRILATLTQPDKGEARVAGYDVVRQSREVRRRIGYVAQNSSVDKHATGRENLTLQAQIQRVPRSQIAERVSSMLHWVGLGPAADRIVHTYSGGMQRRLDIAMGLSHTPAVLFLDEPTTGLDPETRSALWDDLLRLRQERQLAVLVTTHYLDEADRLCDRVAIVDHGRIVAQGTPTELKSQIRGDIVTLDLHDQCSDAPQRLQQIESVREIMLDGNTLVARVTNGASALPGLITTLEQAGIKVSSAAINRPTLDDVYLYHTGRRLAGEEATGPSRSVKTQI